MKTYKMTAYSLKNKIQYTIYGENGEVIATRKSDRMYLAATVAYKKVNDKDVYRVNYHGKKGDAANTSDASRYRNAGYDVGVAY